VEFTTRRTTISRKSVSSPLQFSEDGLMGGAISACVRDPDGNLILLGRGSANELEQWLS
jgi:hypothetical protein